MQQVLLHLYLISELVAFCKQKEKTPFFLGHFVRYSMFANLLIRNTIICYQQPILFSAKCLIFSKTFLLSLYMCVGKKVLCEAGGELDSDF